MKKILILTASPIRDRLVDELIAKELRKLKNEVLVRPCLREGRQAVLEHKPDVVVMPPIRNVYSRDFVEQLKLWNVGVVSRHTEASCDWQDFKKANQMQKVQMLGSVPYYIDLELVWGEDEAQILRKRRAGFPTEAVGSFSADKYLNQSFRTKLCNREKFNKKYNFTKDKTILIGSPWGFVDSAPDLNIDDISFAKKEKAGFNRQIDMIVKVRQACPDYNVLVTIHPGVAIELYKKALATFKIPLDTESVAMELITNSDILVHGGSTMAMGAHFLDKSAFQFGDVNRKEANDWWSAPDNPLSKISPYCKTAEELILKIKKVTKGSNANKKTIKALEKGRYGKMDGKATKRAAKLINKISGKFTMRWPEPTRDYSQITLIRNLSGIARQGCCGICQHPFLIVKDEWIKNFCNFIKVDKKVIPKFGICCPWCGARLYSDISNNPSPIEQPKTAEQSPSEPAEGK